MSDILTLPPLENHEKLVQCQYYVVRKKRLCRMTVKPGNQYCGEHKPNTDNNPADGKFDARIPCPYDPKHSCFTSKLEKHLSVCNARETEAPPYIVRNVNNPPVVVSSVKRPLSQIPPETILRVLEKVDALYEKHVAGAVQEAEESGLGVHWAVAEELVAAGRGEASRRHLRQVSRLLQLAEAARLAPRPNTCYLELGAGKGQVSYYMGVAWCGGTGDRAGSRVVALDRAALRHKRDNALACAERLRADLAHVALRRVPAVARTEAAVGIAKHLCGAATDLALRALVQARAAGAVLATCCHHRCDLASYVAVDHLQELGLTEDDMNVMLGVVSWATCGDGRARAPAQARGGVPSATHGTRGDTASDSVPSTSGESTRNPADEATIQEQVGRRAERGRRAKLVLEWGRVLFLRARGYAARLCRYVPAAATPENIAIIATLLPPPSTPAPAHCS